MLRDLIEPSTGTNIDLTATTVTINGTFVDSSDSRLKYDIDNVKSNCMLLRDTIEMITVKLI